MKKIKIILVVSLVLNMILGYMFYTKWHAEVASFRNDYQGLYLSNYRIDASLSDYLATGNKTSLASAVAYAEGAQLQVRTFGYYYGNELGSKLTGYLGNFYFNLHYNMKHKSDNKILKEYLVNLKSLKSTMPLPPCDWVLGYFPDPPITKQNAQQILQKAIAISKLKR